MLAVNFSPTGKQKAATPIEIREQIYSAISK